MVTDRDISLTFLKGMSVLKAFDEDQTHMSIADIARATDLDPATARRLVLTLVRLGYVRKDNRTFSLTPRILILASGFLRGNNFGKFIQPLLNNCASETGLAVSLFMADGADALLVAQSTLRSTSITHGFTIGSRLPLLNTAIGRMLLAYGAEEWADDIIANGPVGNAPHHGVFDREGVRASIGEAMQKGFAVVRGEFEIDVTGVAVPIGRRGTTRATLGVSDASKAFDNEERLAEVVNALRRSANELARGNLI